jgi:hypothetical protein
MQIQVDNFVDSRGKPTGITIMLAEGLAILVPDSRMFRRGRAIKELTECCPRCNRRIRFWRALRPSHDHNSPRIGYLECGGGCLVVGFDIDKYEQSKLTAAWQSFIKLQNTVLAQHKRLTAANEN